nr:unnamed protein product [Spirometra erinaceieuropaei]
MYVLAHDQFARASGVGFFKFQGENVWNAFNKELGGTVHCLTSDGTAVIASSSPSSSSSSSSSSPSSTSSFSSPFPTFYVPSRYMESVPAQFPGCPRPNPLESVVTVGPGGGGGEREVGAVLGSKNMQFQLSEQIDKLKHYGRYFDDIFAIATAETDVATLLDAANQAHPSIKFTLEMETAGSLPFFDVLLSRRPDGSVRRSVHRKKTRSGQYTNFASSVPLQQKRNLIRCLVQRARKSCSTDSIEEELRKIQDFLRENGYPERFIEKNIAERPIKTATSTTEKKTLFLKVPFQGDAASELLRRRFDQALSRTFPAARVQIAFSTNPILRGEEDRRQERAQVTGMAGPAPRRTTSPPGPQQTLTRILTNDEKSDGWRGRSRLWAYCHAPPRIPAEWECHKGHIKKEPLLPDSQTLSVLRLRLLLFLFLLLLLLSFSCSCSSFSSSCSSFSYSSSSSCSSSD